MKQKIIIVGISLITFFILMGSVSAATLIGHGSKTINDGDGFKKVYTWTAYKYNNNYVKQIIICKAYFDGDYINKLTYTNIITKPIKSKVKITSSEYNAHSRHTNKFTQNWCYKGSAYNFYKTKKFQTNYLKNYLL